MPRKVTDKIKMLAGACALTLALVPMSASAGPGGGGMGGGSVSHVTPMPRPTSGMPRPTSGMPRTASPSVTTQPDVSQDVPNSVINKTRPTPESPLMANPDIKAPGPTTGTRIRTPVVAPPATQRERNHVPPPGGA